MATALYRFLMLAALSTARLLGEDEKRVGFGSILYIRCMQCLLLNQVDSSERYKSPAGYSVFKVNTTAVLAALHTGQDHTKAANQATVMGIPSMSHTTWKRHERYLQPAIEEVTQNSMQEFIAEERRLTLEDIEDLKRYLPKDVDLSLIISSGKNPKDLTDNEIVRIFVSFDFGWSKRGNGKQYDSKNGYGALIGYFTGKVLDFRTMHVSCRSCNEGIPKDAHDCRQNFSGTSKAMEAEASCQLVVKNKLFLKYNVQVGIIAGDNDSSSIHAIHAEIDHLIIKGDAAGLAKALKNIPYYAFNKHNDYGDWCGYKAEKENYDHRSIPGGFQSPELFKATIGIFDKLVEHADRFASVASSQSNESLNNSITRKLPKNVCYCLTESADNRIMCAICQKNLSFKYVKKILEFLNIAPDDYTKEKNETASNCLKKKIEKSKLQEVKLRRRASKIKNKRLSKVLAVKETNTYETNSTPTLVYYDLETGGFSYSADIIQTAFKYGDLIYTSYVTPTKKIDDSASKVHGLTYQGKQLYAHDSPRSQGSQA
ncbi:hypothetical protein PV327_011064 [Microctonus hyperodae]|uniref:Mutator-like transposase domain-containing protein n=1 Tax=Microctonus hyperodae TaxID=165561 RepID=A0AA39KUI7_MICHY|nr:hypothetical protein PV327_011064 [Microctonus hyperodae]